MSRDSTASGQVIDRDHLTAGLVLARALLADRLPDETGWTALTVFHTEVASPLLGKGSEMLPENRDDLLRWGRITGLDIALRELAFGVGKAPSSNSPVVDDELLLDLVELSEQMASTTGRPDLLTDSDSPEVFAFDPEGRSVLLRLRQEAGSQVSPALSESQLTTAQLALDSVLEHFPDIPRPSMAESSVSVRWPPGVPILTSGMQLPFLLAHLARITRFTLPDLLVFGDVHARGFAPITPDTLAACRDTAKAADRELLVPMPRGWTRYSLGEDKPKSLAGPVTLDGVATLLWGEAWAQWKADRHAEALNRMGWNDIDWSHPPQSQPVRDVEVRQVGQLRRHYLESGQSGLAFLGGHTGSGKSTIVRLLAASLAGSRNPWLVKIVAGPTRELPDRNVAVEAGLHALASASTQSKRQLLVFEDLLPIGNPEAGEVLAFVAERLRVNVLGVLQYGENSLVEWNTSDKLTATSVVGRRAVEAFIEDLGNADLDLDPAPARAAIAAGPQVDLRDLTSLMAGGSTHDEARAVRYEQLTETERDALVLAAALSLILVDIDETKLATVEEPDRRIFGVGPGRLPASLRLMTEKDCLALLDLYEQNAPTAAPQEFDKHWEVTNRLIFQQVYPRLAEALRDGAAGAVDYFFGARLFHSALCRDLLDRSVDDGLLANWGAQAPATSVAKMLGFSDLMTEDAARRLAEHLAQRLPLESPDWLPADLLGLIRHLQDADSFISELIQEDLVRWLVQTIDLIVERQIGRPDERFALLQAIERYSYNDDVSRMLMERLLDVLAGLRADRVEDYRLIARVTEMQRRVARHIPEGGHLFHIDQEGPVQRLLKHQPIASDGIGVLLESMNLRLFYGADWEVMLPEFEPHLNSAMRFATAAELAQTLTAIRSTRQQFPLWLLPNWTDFTSRVRELLRRSAAADAAALLTTIAKANNIVAGNVLHDHPKYTLAKTLADRAATTRDAKGIGLLLSATRSIDELFRMERNFSNDLAEALTEDTVRSLLESDPRVSVRYHIIKGVWDAEASYRKAILGSVIPVVVSQLRYGRKHWGPEIALRLASDLEMGPLIVSELRERVRPQWLIEGMNNANTAYGRAVYHRLGRVLHPDVAQLYLAQWEQTPFAEQLTPTPAGALEVCAEAGRTLTEAGLPDAGPTLMAATGGVERWSQRLSYGRKQEPFTHAIRSLTKLDFDTAGEVVDRLGKRQTRVMIAGHPATVLSSRLRQAFLDGPSAGPELLRAIHEVRPQIATELLQELAGDNYTMYIFRGEIQWLQDPMAQSSAALNLFRAGLRRNSPQSKWIENVYNVRIQTIHKFTGPRPIVALLRMLSTWDAAWGLAAAEQVNLKRVGRRLRSGSLSDLPDAVELIRSLIALGNRPAAAQLLSDLLHPDFTWYAQNAELTTLCDLLNLLRDLDSDALPRIARSLGETLDRHVRRPVVFDEKAQWLQVGRASRLLRHLGAAPFHVGQPRPQPNAIYAPAVAWAATGLDQPDWGNDALGRVALRLKQELPRLDPTDQACVLLATGRGWAPELRATDMTWSVGQAPFWLLRKLYQDRFSDPFLEPILESARPTVLERVNSPMSRANWDASQLRFMVTPSAFDTPSSPADTVRKPTNTLDGASDIKASQAKRRNPSADTPTGG